MSKDHIKLDEWDIVKWLTVVSDDYGMERCIEAADEIKRLREALREIEWSNNSAWQSNRARAALGEEKK
jgi:hypothetical protein